MFERYTETARRSIFFARYEANKLVSLFIEPEHLLLGVLHEGRTVVDRLSFDDIHAAIARTFPSGQSVSTNTDFPLSPSGKRVLSAAAEEADDLNHRYIGTGHLVLGLLRDEDTLASKLLRQNGLDAKLFRQQIREPAPNEDYDRAAMMNLVVHLPGRLGVLVHRLNRLMVSLNRQKRELSDVGAEERKEALGGLIDWAITHHQWFACELSEPKLAASGYPEEALTAVQPYRTFSWPKLIDLWPSMNTLLAHILAKLPNERLDMPRTIGAAQPMPLLQLVTVYVAHCEDMMKQILTDGPALSARES